ncbi:MAG: 3-methyl-2-oxobutanoate dehydrogenase subunit VorB [Candidatus Auribacterota bacterium]|jgi:2-oxoglutarate ferredoxin oxidoreductase subunit alpha|uniref:3-methyl-2-oxobutanoate dehydrogenase subunit VorB n=1 Tax=Candidatus Auribacter fodinae TaxID=2093366 RepID=A0A3A4R2H6_9BACT|nr:MAG: 3-methyl-2-oxobutanoate dehydrogenase subunit VorB [Candidatus Auribacter fodinae]
MSKKELLCGNEAISEAAIKAGCRYYYGYPITPQNEISAYMALHLPKVDGTFIQAESEIAAINMAAGTAATGKRVMTSSSGPGLSLKQEGLSFFAAAELPLVVVDAMRAGPGLGNITPSQADYFQATRGGGHGDYRQIVLAPASVSEAAELTRRAFYLADKYRIVAMLLLDGMLAQTREPVVINQDPLEDDFDKSWAVTGCKGRTPNVVKSLFLQERSLEEFIEKQLIKYSVIEETETEAELYHTADAEYILIAYGTPARMCRSVVDRYRAKGIKVGLLRPVTLWPYPSRMLRDTLRHAKHYLVVEWSAGQMFEDVRIALGYDRPIHLLSKLGGSLMDIEEIDNKLDELLINQGARI